MRGPCCRSLTVDGFEKRKRREQLNLLDDKACVCQVSSGCSISHYAHCSFLVVYGFGIHLFMSRFFDMLDQVVVVACLTAVLCAFACAGIVSRMSFVALSINGNLQQSAQHSQPSSQTKQQHSTAKL